MKRLLLTLLTSISIFCCQAMEVSLDNQNCKHELSDQIDLNANSNSFLTIAFDNLPADITISCDVIYDFIPTATTDCVLGGATVTATDVNFSTTLNCPVILEYQRVYLAQSPCGDFATHVQNITVIDDVAPVADNCPPDVTGVECEDDVPVAPVTFTDNCDTDLSISFSQLIVNEDGAQADSCLLLNSEGLSVSELWAFWFPDFPGDHGLDDQWVWTNAQIPSFVRMGDMAFITGQIESLTNPGYIFDVNMKVKDRLDWNQWSALLTTNAPPINRTFKDAPGFATMGGQSLFEDWDYYVIDPTQSFLTGQGVLAGSSLQLFHEPSNLLYGFQVGQAASNKNPNFGMSAWYNYVGTLVVNGVAEAVDGFGDINVDASCTNFPSSICDYDVTRTWTATDDCGNSTTCEQIISVVDNEGPEFSSCPEDITVDCNNIPPVPVITATDGGCANSVTITFNEQVITTGLVCPVLQTIFRIWTAEDACGNVTVCSQTITVVDNEEPVITCPADVSLECGDATPDPTTSGEASATDNCSTTVSIAFSDSAPSGNCPIIITRTWTAIDECGNTSSCDQLLSFFDTVPPTILAGPDTTIDCSDALPTPDATALDACSSVTWSMSESFDPVCGSTGVYTRIYTAIDACGNTASNTQTITVLDTTAPVNLNPPADVTVECDQPIPSYAPLWSDDCGTITETAISGVAIDGCTELQFATYSATDECGNSTSVSRTVTIVDTTAPTIAAAADETIECDEAIPAADATVSDNCQTATWTVAEVIVPGNCPQNFTIERTYSADDGCGNISTDTQTITVQDTTAPVNLNPPVDVTVECDQPIPGYSPQWSNNCGTITETAISGIAIDGCTETQFATYTATDECGNSTSVSRTVTIVDTTAPTIAAAADETIECDEAIPAADATVSDNCQTATWTVTEVIVPGNCPQNYTIERTYTADDGCGNTATDTQTITVQDTTPPFVEANPDMTIECGDPIPNGGYTAFDTCGDISVALSMSTPPGCGDTKQIIRTYTITDECGNVATDQQIITIEDTTPPTIVPANDVTIECGDQVPVPSAVAEDICGDATWTVSETFASDCGDTGVYTRVYTATDECGNTSTATQTISVQDTTAPVNLNPPADVTIECDQPIPGYSPEWSDNCGTITETAISGVAIDGCNELQFFTYTATDECGNSTSVSRTVTIVDTTPPVIICPADLTLPCNSPPPAIDLSSVTATDNCEVPMVSHVGDAFGGDFCTAVITRTYMATDACGNTATCEQTITIPLDFDAPVISLIENITIECGEPVPVPDATVEDGCSDPTLTMTESFDPGCGNTGTYIRVYTAIDDCGNTASATQTITIVDTTPPFVEADPDMTIECGDPVPPNGYTAFDTCGEISVGLSMSTPPGCGNTKQIIRTYIITDECGNVATDQQIITIVDTTPPTLVPASDATIECTDPIPAASATASDTCGDATWTVSETFAGDCGDTGIYTRVYTATDDCGNIATATQTITIVDTTAPSITAAPDATIECTDPIPTADATATDTCGDATWTVSETFAGDCGDTGVYTRVYTATDVCGNIATATQTITIVDTTAPSITAAPDATIECTEPIPAADATASDTCGDATWTVSETFAGDCGDTGVYTRVYTATDACGNTATATQTITIVDTTAPSITAAPDATIECTEPIPAADATATDTCGDATWTVSETFAGDCGETGVYTRVYTATDACGNTTSATQTITVIDTTAPVNLNPPIDVTVECDQPIPAYTPEWSDNCGTITETAISGVALDGCTEFQFATYTATDECGNSTSVSRTVTLIDTTAPELTVAPNETLDCNDPIPAASAIVTDNCQDPTWTATEVVIPGSCPQEMTIVRTYTADDGCGNTTEAIQTLLIIDDTAPTLEIGADVIIECDMVVPAPFFTSEDDCGTPTVEVSEVTIPGTCPQEYTLLRTYLSMDECGNEISKTQTIEVVDTTAPTLVIGEDVILECDMVVPGPFWIAEDNCGDPMVTVTVVETPGSCPQEYILQRTYVAMDDCGNETAMTQTIEVVDSNPPSLIVGADATVECDDPIPGPAWTSDDDCGEPVVTFVENMIAGACPNAYELERTYTSVDDCGNSISATQTITVVDTTAPSITVAPDATIECTDPIPAADATASDTCGDATWTVSETFAGDCGETGVYTRVYTATDACGNTATATQTITIVDTTAPSITAAPDATIECTDPIPAADATATDTCGDATWTVSETFAGDCGDTGVYTRVYTATDACGNIATATQTITIVDTTAPSITVAPDATIECTDPIPAADATASDTCGDATWTVSETFAGDCGETGVYTRVYTATDACGNIATATQTITIVDTTAPSITAAPDATIECTDPIPAADATASDTCGDATWTVSETFAGDCGDTGVYTRVYTATDACGNTATATQTITIVDTTAPSITAAPDATIECTDPIPAADATATDTCGDATWTVSETFAGDCGDTGVYTRVYTATDACGNIATATQTITIVDTTAPSITAAPDATIECTEPIPAADATASDTCGDATWTVSETFAGDCGDTGVYTRVYTATDDCGNIATATQTITIVDTTAPSIIAAPDATIECTEPIPAADATATDTCGDATWTVSETFAGDCGDTGVYTRVYTATDACGNTATATQTITIVDTTAPSITAAPDATIECTDPIPAADATASDTCGDATWTVSETFAGDCGDTGVYTRVYTATDACGNTATATQTITIVDTTAPSITAAPDATIECTEPIPAADATASDTCGDATWTVSETFAGDCGDTGVYTRVYTATDACGNTATATQTITIVDTTAPSITAAPDATIECTDPIPAADATATDTCGDATWTVSETFAGDCGDTGVYTRVYTATDACGNIATATQTITIVDTTAPSITVAPDATIECTEPIPAADATASDTCGDATWTVSETFAGDCGETGVYTRVYTATDACGNIATATQTITIVDTTAPSITAAPDATIECTEPIPAADATATDTCGDATWTVSETFAGDCGDTGVYTRVYTATDACGNTATATQTITIVDTTAPSITAAPDATIECTEPIPAADATATDTCGDATWTVSETFAGDCGDTGVYTRVYTATDACGNTATATQTITIVDTTAPSITAAPDATIECTEPIPAADATATDTCGDATWIVSETFAGDCGDTGVYTRVYTATDACGNTATATQTITIVDTTAPTIIPAADVTLECGDALPPADAVATDTCGDATWTVVADITETCGETFVMVRTYTATDDCGNTASADQTITVLDTTAPSLTIADDLTLECDETVPPADATATDSCGNATWSVVEDVTSGACPQEYTLIRTYTAIDDCGNIASDIQTIVVIDTTAPVLSDLPANMTVPCDAIPAPVALTASDNCDTDVPVSYSEIVGTGCNYSIFRTWTATDDCGNTTSHTQEIMTVDDEAPSINVPEDQTLECDELVPAPFYIANDNCDEDLIVEVVELIIPGDCPQEYTLERTYTATDNCGNSSSAIETIYVIDTTAPIILQPIPVSAQKECTDLGIDVMDLYNYLEGNLNAADSAAVEQAILDLFDSCGLVPNATDNCGDVTLTPISLLIAGFNSLKFPETGYLEVVWQASDECGNISVDTKTTSIEVVDNTHPQALCQDITVELGQDGYVIVDPYLVDNGSSDNCGPVFISLAEDSLTCEDIGVNLATLLVFDLGGNLSTCSATITLVNNNPSGLLCPDDLDIGTDKDQCVAFIGTAILWARPSDPCENMEIMHVVTYADGSTSTGGDDASGLYTTGTHVINWTAQGEDGTIHTCSTTVTVTDDQEPSPLCLNITASLNNFEVTVPATSLNALSTDNCIGELAFTVNGQPSISFTCDDLGSNTVFLEVTDESGNVGVCEATVDVQDPLGNCVPEPCDAPSDLAHEFNTDHVLLTWTPPAGAEACQITGGVIGGSSVSIIKYAPNVYEHIIPNNLLNPNADYEWRVRCACELDPLDVSPFSQYDYFNMNSPIAYDEEFELETMEEIDHKILSFDGNSIGLYPNPNSGQFYIETSLLEYNIEIYDLNGKVVYSENNINAQLYAIEIRTVERGFYFVRLFDEFGFDERMKVIIE